MYWTQITSAGCVFCPYNTFLHLKFYITLNARIHLFPYHVSRIMGLTYA
jgi:hypothetical protein